MADKKPQCEATVQDGGRWPHWVQCRRVGSVEISGRHVCAQHAKEARTRGRIKVMTGKIGISGLESTILGVEPDAELVAAERERQRIKDREWSAKQPESQRNKYRRIAAMAIARLRANGVDADDLAGWMTAHLDDVPEGS